MQFKWMKRGNLGRGTLAALAALGAAQAVAIFYDFDSLADGVHSPSDVPGLTIETGSVDVWANVGDTITFSSVIPQFLVSGNYGNASDKIIYAGATKDLLITPDSAFTSASVWSDGFDGAGQDVIRILGLAATGNPYEYLVLDYDGGLDGLIQIAVDSSTFDAIILECTTEQEGFNDLDLTPVPEPATLAALGMGLGLLCRRGRSTSSRA
ncbi:MAG: hypothetical protein CNCCGFBP_02472 [Fimbriimonadaceae bacterium]|nr:hypothetical protein [Fimbriimonadaceae bacterium]